MENSLCFDQLSIIIHIPLHLKMRICAASTEIKFLLALVCTGYDDHAEFDRQKQHIFGHFDINIRNNVNRVLG